MGDKEIGKGPRWLKAESQSQDMGSSKVSRFRATLTGVLVARATGVFQGICAGLGEMLTKSEKSKPWPGVVGKRFPPPGVTIIEDGRSRRPLPALCWGGVLGISSSVEDDCCVARDVDLTAGEGEAARYMRRSAPSSPDLPLALLLPPASLVRRLRLRVCMGGVRGGDAARTTVLALKECAGKRSSSSSDGVVKLGEASSLGWIRFWKKETLGPVEVVKCCCRRGLMGED